MIMDTRLRDGAREDCSGRCVLAVRLQYLGTVQRSIAGPPVPLRVPAFRAAGHRGPYRTREEVLISDNDWLLGWAGCDAILRLVRFALT